MRQMAVLGQRVATVPGNIMDGKKTITLCKDLHFMSIFFSQSTNKVRFESFLVPFLPPPMPITGGNIYIEKFYLDISTFPQIFI